MDKTRVDGKGKAISHTKHLFHYILLISWGVPPMKRLFRVPTLDPSPEFIGPWGTFGDPGQPRLAHKAHLFVLRSGGPIFVDSRFSQEYALNHDLTPQLAHLFVGDTRWKTMVTPERSAELQECGKQWDTVRDLVSSNRTRVSRGNASLISLFSVCLVADCASLGLIDRLRDSQSFFVSNFNIIFVEWSVYTMLLDITRYDRNFSKAYTTASNSFSVVSVRRVTAPIAKVYRTGKFWKVLNESSGKKPECPRYSFPASVFRADRWSSYKQWEVNFPGGFIKLSVNQFIIAFPVTNRLGISSFSSIRVDVGSYRRCVLGRIQDGVAVPESTWEVHLRKDSTVLDSQS
ncbi:hypothetical protein Tco_0899043 [Tanacetum coccineum]